MLARGWLTVVCAASGPSFSEAQAARIAEAQRNGWRVIVVNDSWRRVPSADVLYACDGIWWDVHLGEIRASGFAGELWTCDKRASPAYLASPARPGYRPLRGFRFVAGEAALGLGTNGTIHHGRNSGYQAINLAHLFGARRIVLVGYDMQRTNGQQHFFGDHKKPLSNEIPFGPAIGHFNSLAFGLKAFGVEVINASEQTALQCFKRQTLEEALR